MCTIVAIRGLHPELPLIIAANRDEFYERRSGPPRVMGESPRIVAGIDLEKGGTWMGANERGLFVALTNQRQYHGASASKESRGHVVLDLLRHESAERLHAAVRSLDARRTNSFNLFYGDAEHLWVAYARDDDGQVETEALGEGLWVLPNDRIGSAEFPKTRRAVYLLEPVLGEEWPELVPHLRAALGDHDEPPLEAITRPPPGSMFPLPILQKLQALCIHTPTYGTRSATILGLARGRVGHYLFADGPPCVTAFEDVAELLR
jgi:uncharacterized protein with NRDE domain